MRISYTCPRYVHRIYLAVTTDEDLAVTRIDLGTRKVAQLGPTNGKLVSARNEQCKGFISRPNCPEMTDGLGPNGITSWINRGREALLPPGRFSYFNCSNEFIVLFYSNFAFH